MILVLKQQSLDVRSFTAEEASTASILTVSCATLYPDIASPDHFSVIQCPTAERTIAVTKMDVRLTNMFIHSIVRSLNFILSFVHSFVRFFF